MATHKQHRTLTRLFYIAALSYTVVLPQVLAAETPSAEEIKSISANWVCKWCPYPEKTDSRLEVTAGAGYISNDSYKHGDYSGLNEKGAYLIGDAEYSYQAPQQTYMHVTASELGTDARDLAMEARTQGRIAGSFSYSELPKLNLDTARTPYRGGAHQQLPVGWTAAGTTQAMPGLASALHDVDVYTHRKTFSLGASFQQDNALSYELSFQRDTREGSRTAGLALGNSFALARSAILAIPVDYVTDQGEIKINYVRQRWQAAIAYQFSKFDNGNKFIRWDNAFSIPAAVTEGQAALEPDNSMHKIAATGAYRINQTTSSNGLIAFGQMKQNDSYLPYTVNGALAPFALPVNSLDGKINTFDVALNLNSSVTDRVKVEAKFLHNEQDNDTSRNSYDYVIADTSLSGTSRANFPYSFRKVQYRLLGRYQIPEHELSLGVNREEFDRTYQEVETTTEDTLKVSYRSDVFKNVDIQISGVRSKRDGDKYQPVSEILPPENPLLRKYNLADRDRNQMGITVNYFPQPQWQLALYIEAARDDYSKSDIGLLESIQKDYSVALQYEASKTLSFNVDYSMTTIESTQAGSQSFSVATWHAVNEDQIDVIHFGVNYDVTPKTFSLGAEYSYAKSDGDVKVSTGGPLPSLASERHTILLRGDYRLNNKSTITGFYRYEDYDESDWANDNVNPDTIGNVLSLGETSPSYRIGIIGVAVKHLF